MMIHKYPFSLLGAGRTQLARTLRLLSHSGRWGVALALEKTTCVPQGGLQQKAY